MDGDDSHLVFDFEGTLDAAATEGGSNSVVAGAASAPSARGRAADGSHHARARGSESLRRTVCRHWLRGLCMLGDSCTFLHQYDQDRLPVCQFYSAYGSCREQECVFKHITEDVKECTMYMHVKKPGPPPPVEEVVKKLQQMNSLYYGSSSGIHQRRDKKNNQQEKPQVQHCSALKNTNLVANTTPVVQQPAAHHVQTANLQHVPPPHIQQEQQQNAQVQGVPNGSSDQATITPSPLPHGHSRYSVVKSCNRENLEISVQKGVWASQKGVMVSF